MNTYLICYVTSGGVYRNVKIKAKDMESAFDEFKAYDYTDAVTNIIKLSGN